MDKDFNNTSEACYHGNITLTEASILSNKAPSSLHIHERSDNRVVQEIISPWWRYDLVSMFYQ